jgi:NAD(P)-dependent dehydrogenase (short-subunit alcohol dehydrogenase family)
MPSVRMAVNALLLIIILIIDHCFDRASQRYCGPLKSNINTDRRGAHSLFFVLLHGCQDMSEPTSKIYLVGGASRGVGRLPSHHRFRLLICLPSSAGLALVDEIAVKDPSAIIYAGARDPINGASQLIQLAAKYPGRIQIVKYVSGDKEGNEAIAKEIGAKYGRIDTAIVSAGGLPAFSPAVLLMRTRIIFLGISNYVGKVHETPVEQFTEHFSVRLTVVGKEFSQSDASALTLYSTHC